MTSSLSHTDSRWIAWLQLLRLPSVLTAIADVSMGYLIADGSAKRVELWAALIAISSCLYLGGMVLNDVFDVKQDARERPDRPIPSGRISRRSAAWVGGLLLAVAVVLAWPVTFWSDSAAPLQFTATPLAIALVICILCYDGVFKPTVFGPLFMGACRFLNIMLGIGVTQDATLFETQVPWMVAGGMGLYVMGITWFARREATESPRSTLFAGLVLMILGVALLTLLPLQGGLPPGRLKVTFASEWIWPLLVWLLTSPVWTRCFAALVRPQPPVVQAAVRQALLAIIVVDAAIVLLVAGPPYAVGMLALMLIMGVVSRLIYVT